MAELRALGARSVPIVARGGEYVFAQVISDVVNFLGLEEETGPVLMAPELAARLSRNLETASRLVRQMPDEHLERELPNRPRSWRVLMHHVFQIPNAYLDFEENAEALAYQNLVAPPPDDMLTSEAVAAFGDQVRARFDRWWAEAQDESFDVDVQPYFGTTTRHELLERTVWHSAQHTRQVASLLEQVGISPNAPLSEADIEGLPLTDTIWDEG